MALLAGQGYASVYLSTLPHTGLDGTAYVMFWTINVNVLMLLSQWILEERVRSRALQFCFRYYYFMVRAETERCALPFMCSRAGSAGLLHVRESALSVSAALV